jgi:hypothetical protein
MTCGVRRTAAAGMACEHAPWSPRTTIHSVVFNSKLWIYGGKTGRKDSWAGDVWTMTCAQ